ncbi:SURF1 family cytochrome oxidase biogenesis protein [Rhodococcus sp. SJ-3]|uniref:SURF1 family cytochrome oxidase biogenesis protein n=1 Tax=Rhodococcus sp. SJ-3 TaxID=3454628 RepID=UPI003F78CEE7
MRRLSFLLRPSWLVLALVVVGFAYACFTVLAPWQLGKNTSTEERNDRIAESVSQDPLPVDDLFGDGGATTDTEWRRVIADGSYLPDSDVLVRLRSTESKPAYEVLTPFVLDNGNTILVDRGYVRPVEGTAVPEILAAPTGPVTLEARIRMSEGTVEGKEPFTDAGYLQVYFIDSGQIAKAFGLDLADGYLQLDPEQPGVLEAKALPQLDAGPYLSYGLQWLAFGIMAPLGLAYFVWAEIRERRKAKARNSDEVIPSEPKPTSNEATIVRSGSVRSTSTSRTTSDKLADRYGGHR